MPDDYHGLPTPRTTLAASYVCVLVWCKSCRHQAQADMQKMIDAGMGDVPLTPLRFRCSNCSSSLTTSCAPGGRPSVCSPGSAPRRGRRGPPQCQHPAGCLGVSAKPDQGPHPIRWNEAKRSVDRRSYLAADGDTPAQAYC